jgi:NADH-quinone oxidoreductase subunit G
MANQAVLAPSQWTGLLALVLKQLRSQLALDAKPMPAVAPDLKDWVDRLAASAAPAMTQLAKSMAQSLQSGERKAVWIGSSAKSHPQYGRIHALAQAIAEHCDARLGILVEGANAVGAWQLGLQAVASKQANAHQILAEARKAYVLYQVEPEFDHAAAGAGLAAMSGAETVIAMTAYRSEAMMHYADCLLPIAAFTETSGTVVNMEGRRQSYSAVVKPFAQSRPGWKVLRVLADLLQIPSLAFESIEDLRVSAFAKADACALSNHLQHVAGLFDDKGHAPSAEQALERLAEVPIYACDGVVRRASSLQTTRDARLPALRIHPSTMRGLGAVASSDRDVKGAMLEVSDGQHTIVVASYPDGGVAPGVLRMPMALDANRGLPLSPKPLQARLLGPVSDTSAEAIHAGAAVLSDASTA